MQTNRLPFGMKPTDSQVTKALDSCRKIQKLCPETTCNHRIECCSAGCPNMYLCEFLSIREGVVDRLPRDKRTVLTLGCLRNYLMGSGSRPCVFLDEKMCSIYPHRHIKCRLYGLIPPGLFDRIANSVAKENKVARETLPLSQQCPFVKLKPEWSEQYPDGHVPEECIKEMETQLRKIDRSLGMDEKTQDDGFGFLTYHDWHLLCEFGPEWMETLTQLRLKLGNAEKEQFLSVLEAQLKAAEVRPSEGK